MNTEQKLTLAQARAEILSIANAWGSFNLKVAQAIHGVIGVLDKVQVPSEDEMAVLWLITEKGKSISKVHGKWLMEVQVGETDFARKVISPVDEVKKLVDGEAMNGVEE